jgi:hypothetical protein
MIMQCVAATAKARHRKYDNVQAIDDNHRHGSFPLMATFNA